MSELPHDMLGQLLADIAAASSPANRVIIAPQALAAIRQIEAQRRHWYWRAWWRVRYALPDVLDWVRERMGRQ